MAYFVELRQLVDFKAPDVVHRHALLLRADEAEGDDHILGVGCAQPVLYQLAFPVLQVSIHDMNSRQRVEPDRSVAATCQDSVLNKAC